MTTDPAIRDHQTWLGYLQPDGLVVSPAALVDAQVAVNANALPLQQRFLAFVEEAEHEDGELAALGDLGAFLREFLEWPVERLVGKGCAEPIPEALKTPLREFGETLAPDLALVDPRPADAARPWLLLVQDLPLGVDLDVPVESAEAGWAASPTRRFERLLREVEVPIGLLGNRTHLRLVYAPRGENAGTLTFPVAAMGEVSGRPILAALEMLLSRYRLLAAPSEARLPALLKRSRDYQSRVSTALSQQVLASLYELLRGFQAADEHSRGELLRQVLAEHPDQVYNGLLNVLMRTVFLLYAEDRGLMPGSDLYVRNYAIHGLFERLRADAQQFPDTMHHRYGAWAQLAALFRAVHDGCEHKLLKLPAREGHLFDPDRFPFLEGRTGSEENAGAPPPAPPPGRLDSPDPSSCLRNPHTPDACADSANGGPFASPIREADGTGVADCAGAPSACAVRNPSSEGSGESVTPRQGAGGGAPSGGFGGSAPASGSGSRLPLVSDGTVYRILANLLLLDGERLSYRTLDVEQIGSVYETMMGFRLELARGQTIALEPGKAHGAPVPVDLDELLATAPDQRAKWIADRTDYKLTGTMTGATRAAASVDALLAALERRIARHATPHPAPPGTMLLVPTDERRRTGSHYTPRSLTEPIVRKTLEPILARLWDKAGGGTAPTPPPGRTTGPSRTHPDPSCEVRTEAARCELRNGQPLRNPQGTDALRIPQPATGGPEGRVPPAGGAGAAPPLSTSPGPTPDEILALKVCDPAMGSGAFLVEACRQLADELVRAWAAHGWKPFIPPDEDELLHARRIVAQRCLYGVDRNPMAVDLAKLSLWLTTLAREHPFTFLDHSLRAGDSLVGLTRRQIAGFHWHPEKQQAFLDTRIREHLEVVARERRQILDSGDQMPPAAKRQKLQVADDALNTIRLLGDAVVSAFFHGDRKKAREERLGQLFAKAEERYVHNQFAALADLDAAGCGLRTGEHPVAPFHWEVEFPEVFAPDRGGFDAIVGNPPFLGGRRITTAFGMPYFDWIKNSFSPAANTCDLVAFFFRRGFDLINNDGAFGLIATNTIAQGDTRDGGLAEIRRRGGIIYNATTRTPWPGEAGVIVSVINVTRNSCYCSICLNGKQADVITAFLFNGGSDELPFRLQSNKGINSVGSFVYGRGFFIDDTDEQASPSSILDQIQAIAPSEAYRIFPFFGGEEVNSQSQLHPVRHVIYLSDLREESDLDDFPFLRSIIEQRVRPMRLSLGNNPVNRPLKKRWWAYQAHRPEFYETVSRLPRILAVCRVSQFFAFRFVAPGPIFGESTVLFSMASYNAFGVLQSSCHELWARFFSSTLGDALRYVPSDCFETFPFPPDFETNPALEAAGRAYYEFRAALMVRLDEGLTKTYNRFHDPNETAPDILHLRELHAAMDRAVLDAYGWTDLQPTCEFLLDYEEDDDGEETASRRKKPWRYRWPEDIHDEVLARLLALNAERAEEERRAGEVAESAKAKGKRTRRTKASSEQDTQPGLGL